ncbi:uncharacterized protein LOC130990547 [Salvia miltiorrhiza]|uniref:uncharacterized protein LOC130990547 n=1 Tax=Salvia miltiorrhiza TaxID=226208 RepID=UPI0025AD5B9B|nr:uncharacterized protein LOC130990547 [Salvia miltiorrhiza]
MIPNNGPDVLLNSKEDSDIFIMIHEFKQRFSLKESGTHAQLLKIMKNNNALKDGDNDFKRIFILYIMSAFLASTANQSVDFSFFKSLTNIERVKSFKWSKFVLERMCRGFDSSSSIKHWSAKRIKLRLEAENDAGDFGVGQWVEGVCPISNGIKETQTMEELVGQEAMVAKQEAVRGHETVSFPEEDYIDKESDGVRWIKYRLPDNEKTNLEIKNIAKDRFEELLMQFDRNMKIMGNQHINKLLDYKEQCVNHIKEREEYAVLCLKKRAQARLGAGFSLGARVGLFPEPGAPTYERRGQGAESALRRKSPQARASCAFRESKKCHKAPEHVRTEVNAYMIKKATSKVLNQFARNPSQDVGDYDEEEVEIEGSSSRTITSKVAPASKRMKGPLDVLFASKQPSSQSQEVLKGRKERKRIFGASDKVYRDKACEVIARFFYDNAIPFNSATSDSFKGMVEAIGQYGPGLVPPSMYELRVLFLQKEVEATNTKVMEFKKEWAIKGCSILSDGWRDSVVQKDIVNFLVNSPKGSVFIKSVEVSEVVKDSTTLFFMLDSIVEEVGEMNVVQVVTDNASNYVKAGKKFKSSIHL